MPVVFGVCCATWICCLLGTVLNSVLSYMSAMPGGVVFGMLCFIAALLTYTALLAIVAMMAFKPGGCPAGAKAWLIALIAECLAAVGFVAVAASISGWVAINTFQLFTALIFGPIMVALLHPKLMGAEPGAGVPYAGDAGAQA